MAAPVHPTFASSIWLAHQSSLEADCSAGVDVAQTIRIPTGHRAIDSALNGGFACGIVHCITSEPDRRARELILNVLTSHLLLSTAASATLIDTTLAFDVRKIFSMLLASNVAKRPVGREEAMSLLQHLEVMQVFDFVGMNESVGELRDSLQGGGTRPRGTVGDSEDEDEVVTASQSSAKQDLNHTAPERNRSERPTRLLIIDSVSHVAMPLVQNSYPQGQALVSSFMQSLSHLTKAWNLCTIVLCNASTKRSAGDDALSQFASCHIRPALGTTFAYLVDMLMYVHSLPCAPTTKSSLKEREQDEAENAVSIIEIVQDRYGAGLGRWAPFAWNSSGCLEEITHN